MIRYLKYVFLIFGSLGLLIIGFFVFQNKKDLKLAWDFSNRLDYEDLVESCENVRGSYYYPCFKENFSDYLDDSGLTGISIGLKMAFNFMDKDKESTTVFETEKLKDLHYALNYLELNNMAINQSWRRFYGFENMYGGYLSSLRDFLDGAKKFSDNLIAGLEGEEGVSSVEDPELRKRVTERFKTLKKEYEQTYGEARGFAEKEIESFLKKAEG